MTILVIFHCYLGSYGCSCMSRSLSFSDNQSTLRILCMHRSGSDKNFRQSLQKYCNGKNCKCYTQHSALLKNSRHKRKLMANNTLKTQQEVCFSIDDILKKIQKQSLTTFVNCVIVIIFLVVSGATELKLNSLKFEEIGHFPNNLIYHYRNLVAPLLAITLIISICFQNKNYKQSIKEKIKMLYCEICNQSIT